MAEIELPGDQDLWVIAIGGYGSFLFRGNEADAEFMRAGKAQWERGEGLKWRQDDPTFGLPADAPKHRVRARKTATIAAGNSAKMLMHCANWRNYGRSPESLAAIAALTNGTTPEDGANETAATGSSEGGK